MQELKMTISGNESLEESKAEPYLLNKLRRQAEEVLKMQPDKAERKVHDGITFTEGIVNTIREPLIILDNNLRVISVNKSFYQTFKIPPSKTEGKFIYELGDHQWDIPKLKKLLEHILPDKASFNDFEVEHDFPVIGHKIMLLNARQIYQKEIGTKMILLAIDDITEKREGEKALERMREKESERAQKLESLERKMEKELERAQKLESLGTLAGGIAHDFKNILAAIVGRLSLAKLYLNPEDKVFDLLTQAEKVSLQGTGLTQQLLTFSKGGAPITKSVSILELLKDASIFTLSGSKVRCEFFLSENLRPVEIDEGQIRQVLNNLIMNADQAMPQGGIIRIYAKNITLGSQNSLPLKKGKYIKVSIKDQGCGISKNHLNLIFDPYFTTKEKGSGLGLATSHSIIKKHGGLIIVKSRVGVGTTFHIYLPASEKEIVTVEKVVDGKPLFGRGKILFMDDKEDLREMARMMLNYLRYDVVLADSGDEAIELYKKAKKSGQAFNAVMLDLIIPGGMGGKEAIQKLLEIDPEVKAIVSSAHSNDSIISNYEQYGFKGVIEKPYSTKKLSEVLYKIIIGEERPQEAIR